MRLPRWLRRERKSPPGLTIEEMHVTKERGIELTIKHPCVAAMAEAAAEFFVAEKGINFVTMAFWTEKVGYMNVEFRRESGKPLAKMLDELRGLLKEYTDCPAEFEDERMDYVTVQVPKSLRAAAKALLPN